MKYLSASICLVAAAISSLAGDNFLLGICLCAFGVFLMLAGHKGCEDE